jgi:hypothetical protein
VMLAQASPAVMVRCEQPGGKSPPSRATRAYSPLGVNKVQLKVGKRAGVRIALQNQQPVNKVK